MSMEARGSFKCKVGIYKPGVLPIVSMQVGTGLCYPDSVTRQMSPIVERLVIFNSKLRPCLLHGNL